MDSIFTTFLASCVTVTFVMMLAALFRTSDLIVQGVAVHLILLTLFQAIPPVLTLSIPIGIMIASLLVFERLSGEGEIIAMKASGISIWQIIRQPLLFSLLATAICLWIHSEIAPRGDYLRRKIKSEFRKESPTKLIEPGRFVRDFPGLTVYVGQKRGEELRNIVIYDNRTEGTEREIRAGKGSVRISDDQKTLEICLRDKVRVDPMQAGHPGAGFMKSLSIYVDLGTIAPNEYKKKISQLTFSELFDSMIAMRAAVANATRADVVYKMALAVDFNKRLVLSFSCIAFVLLGIALGMRTPRSSSSAGIALSLGVVFAFYLCTVLVDSLTKYPETRPDIIVWAPVLLMSGLGLLLLRRNA